MKLIQKLSLQDAKEGMPKSIIFKRTQIHKRTMDKMLEF